MGLDPGTASLGVALIEKEGNYINVLNYKSLHTPKKQDLKDRLNLLYDMLNFDIAQLQPSSLAFEEIYFNKNARTAFTIGSVIGVILLICGQRSIPVFTYSPPQVKLAVAGYGRASKKQVQEMLKILLNLKAIPSPDDAADALAVAYCHASCQSLLKGKRHAI